jgi:hypothetical protein
VLTEGTALHGKEGMNAFAGRHSFSTRGTDCAQMLLVQHSFFFHTSPNSRPPTKLTVLLERNFSPLSIFRPLFRLVVTTFRLAIPTFRLAVPTFRLAFPTFRLAFPTFRLAIPTFRLAFPTFRLAFPTFRTAVPTLRLAFPTFRTAFPTFRLAIPTFRLAFPTFRTAFPRSVLPIPRAALAFPRSDLPKARRVAPSPPRRKTPPVSPRWVSLFQILPLKPKWKPLLTSSMASWVPCNAGAEWGRTEVFGDEAELLLGHARRSGKREFSWLRRPSDSAFAHQAPRAARGRLMSSATSLSYRLHTP